MTKKLNNIALLAALFFLSACSLNYKDGQLGEELKESTPDTIIYNFTHKEVKQGVLLYEIQAKEARTFSKTKQTHLFEVHFKEFNTDGTLAVEGSADFAKYFTDNEDAYLEGNLDLYTATEEARIEADELNWESSTKLLSSGEDQFVNITKDDGSSMRGTGFEGDMKYKVIRFKKQSEGIYVSED